jgi:FkbM family methyltransferase
MLISAKKVGLNMDDFIIACLDENSYNSFKSYKNAYLAMDHPIKTYADWSYDDDSEFRTIIKHKWSIIEEHYKTHKNLCYLDTDIVFANNPLPYIENSDKILFQRAHGEDGEKPLNGICSGFMVFNDTIKCAELIHRCSTYTDDDDQLLINQIAVTDEFIDSFELLPIMKFPLARDICRFNEVDIRTAVLHHSATLVGIENKINYIKDRLGMWYINMSELNLNWLEENFKNKEIVVFDIGSANLHDTVRIKQVLPDAKFYSFECNKVWEKGNYNTALNCGIYHFQCAVTDKEGEETFYPSDTLKGEPWHYSGSVCPPVETSDFEWGEPYTVRTVRLDTFCERFGISPTFIHIDVQGAEYKVLSCLGKYRPIAIWAEICEFENVYETGTTYQKFKDLMEELGYVSVCRHNGDELFVFHSIQLTPYTIENTNE